MQTGRLSGSSSLEMIIVAALVLLATSSWAASTIQSIYSFKGSTDGEYTDTELVRDSVGNLYGTSVQGGAYGSGTVFRVTPAGVHTVLYSFKGAADGGEPYKGVTLDPQGNLWGTTVSGGEGPCDGGCGVVYKLAFSGGNWHQSIVHSFTDTDGSGPGSPVSIDRQGNVYGTTPTGGSLGLGVVYELTPANGSWAFQVIHTFTGGTDGSGGSAGKLLINSAGELYGVCTEGGDLGFGTVYKLAQQNGAWQFTTLYAFHDQPDGALPYGGLIQDRAGNLYGTTYYAGEHDWGTVYELADNNGAWNETVLYSFHGGSDGGNPISKLVSDAQGNLYGTTSAGGAASCGCGTIFKLTRANGTWTESVAYRFLGAPKPGFAYNSMVPDGQGSFYGATVHGGGGNDGAIYKFTP